MVLEGFATGIRTCVLQTSIWCRGVRFEEKEPERLRPERLALMSEESLALMREEKAGRIAEGGGFEEVMPGRLRPEKLALVNVDSRR